MNRKRKQEIVTSALVALLLITFAVTSVFASTDLSKLTDNKRDSPSFYVGVTFGGNTTAEAKLLIDRVKSYSNLLVLQSGPVSKNETAMTEISEYTITSGLHLMVYFGWLDPAYSWRLSWLDLAKQRWGDRFLGVYVSDEPSGVPLDYNWSGYFIEQKLQNSVVYQEHAAAIDHALNGTAPHDLDEAATLSGNIIERDLERLKNHNLTTFTSDYVLYWFDYKGGYDVILTQLGWNQSVTQQISLLRGAARVQNKDWGAIITWKYNAPPYLDSGEEIYGQLMTAYEAGAKYGIVFNYPQLDGNPYGVLADEHFEALERFWNDAMLKPKTNPTISIAEAVLVLPSNYGFGLRRADDRIWGYWGPDDKSVQVWDASRKLLSEYGLRLDIVYEDPAFQIAGKYSTVYYWNQSLPNLQNNPSSLGFQNSYVHMYSECPAAVNRNPESSM